MKISIQKVAFLSLLAGVLPACQEAGTKQVRSDGSIPVTVLQPTTVELPRTYVADIQAIQFVEIKPKVEGYVKEVLIDEGEFVKKGQPMFRLSSENYAEAVKEAEANYKQTEAELEMANYEMERIERLVNKQIYSPIRLEQAKREREVARMKVEQARAGFARVIASLRDKEVSPEQLQAALNRMQGSYYRERQSLGSRAGDAATDAVLGNPRDFQKVLLDKAAKLTPADVQDVARRYLVPEGEYDALLRP